MASVHKSYVSGNLGVSLPSINYFVVVCIKVVSRVLSQASWIVFHERFDLSFESGLYQYFRTTRIEESGKEFLT